MRKCAASDPVAGWGGGRSKKHEIYVAAFGGHHFYDLFVQGWGGHGPLGGPLDSLLMRPLISITPFHGKSYAKLKHDVTRNFLRFAFGLISCCVNIQNNKGKIDLQRGYNFGPSKQLDESMSNIPDNKAVPKELTY